MSSKDFENLAESLCSLDDLPVLPRVALLILEKIKKPETSMYQLAEILATDPPLSAKVLNVVNSPFFGLSQKITNLPHAVNLLGEESLKYIALSFSLVHLFKKEANRFDYSGFWRQSLVCAVVSRLLAKQMQYADAEDLYLLGLLHNIGKLVLAQSRPQQYAMVMNKVNTEGMLFHHAENEIFGCSHPEIGAFLMTRWGMPEKLTLPVVHHHNPESPELQDVQIIRNTRILHLSEKIYSFLYEEEHAMHLAIVRELLDEYEMAGKAELDKVLEQACCQINPLLPFFDLESDSSMDYLKILERSKRELFRLSFSLTRKVREQQEQIGTLSRLAYRDGLTRLRNFQSFQEAMEREMAAIERHGHSSVLAMMDLDHFKAVNDAHGHAAGDKVLRAVGRFFEDHIRKTDVVARYGGEEFILILSRTPADKGFQILDRLRRQLAGLEVDYKGNKLSVTMSVGITGMNPGAPLPKSELLWQADQALYAAKNMGRNRCATWKPD